MFETSALVKALNAAGTSVAEEHGSTWTGATFLRTTPAEETGLDNDIDIVYFQLQNSGGGADVYWVDENGLDEMSDEDVQAQLP